MDPTSLAGAAAPGVSRGSKTRPGKTEKADVKAQTSEARKAARAVAEISTTAKLKALDEH